MEVAAKNSLLVCTQLECETTEEMQASIEQAKVEGADLVELCIDSMEFSHISEVDKLIQHPTLPAIVSYSARLDTRILSHRTNYAAGKPISGIQRTRIVSGVYIEGINDKGRQRLFQEPCKNTLQLIQDRKDGWMEIEMGEFFNKNGDDGTLLCSLHDFDKFGTSLIIQGIEVRPKKG